MISWFDRFWGVVRTGDEPDDEPASFQPDEASARAVWRTKPGIDRLSALVHRPTLPQHLTAMVEEPRFGDGRGRGVRAETAPGAIDSWVNEGGAGGEVRR